MTTGRINQVTIFSLKDTKLTARQSLYTDLSDIALGIYCAHKSDILMR
jgi:hypothetical protein